MRIAFTGNKGCGKTTCAKLASTLLNQPIESFASPIKHIVQHVFNLTDDQLNDHKLKEVGIPEYGFSPRQMFQFIGTDCFRDSMSKQFPQIGEGVWVDRMERMIKQSSTDIIIDDLRFLNEFRMVKCNGYKVIRITGDMAHPSIHKSESEHMGITADYTISGRDIEELKSIIVSSKLRARL